MGGCRCTYRNCTVKSDGQTHMFHYPVFEKVRCHQWLINAHRLDFLDLKVSQVKNRVICQHHFKDEFFMNFKKGKLTFDAIPTEDGPYCDSTRYDGKYKNSKLYSIILEDIDEEQMNGFEKKKIFSMKYGDFLTNCDLTDADKIDGNNSTYKHEAFDIPQIHNKNKFLNVSDYNSLIFKLSLPDRSVKKTQTQPILIVPPYVNSSNECKNEIQQENQQVTDKTISLNDKPNVATCNTGEKDAVNQQIAVVKKPKVRIISEKKITEPVSFTGKFEPVSPNFVLNCPMKNKNSKSTTEQHTSIDNSKEHSNLIVTDLMDIKNDNMQEIEIQLDPLVKIEDKTQPTFSSSETSQSINLIKTTPLKVSVLKPKLAPERAAAIEKKRNFNKKLRDIIETCLDKLENADKVNDEIKPQENMITERKLKRNRSQYSPILNTHDFGIISYLESRMSKMEKTLLSKIEQNSERISELNNSVGRAFVKKNAPIQTKSDEESYKKQLFQEISKYLTPSSKSLIYEELFINKFTLSELNTSPKQKRRRCR